MPIEDDLPTMLAGLGEPITLAGQPTHGLWDEDGQVLLDGIASSAVTCLVSAELAAERGQPLVRNGTSYRVRQVLPEPPDGALHQLVLTKL